MSIDNPLKRILVVDDSQTVRMKIRKELEAGGCEVTEAKDGLEALVRTGSNPPFDLITLDIEMPRMNGFDTCRRLRSPRYAGFVNDDGKANLPIIFITGNDTVEDRKTGFELGAVEFLSKPFSDGEILATVNKILHVQDVSQRALALVADDSAVAREVASRSLSMEGIHVIEVEDGQQAYDVISQKKCELDIVITDLIMPRMDGIQLCTRIRRELAMPDIPIIVLSSVSELSEIVKVFKAGASDYLVKPYVKEELLARAGVHIERNRIYRELREKINLLEAANKKIEVLSTHDPLVGCFNRGYLNTQLQKDLKRSERYGNPLSIIMADIDHFKQVNDVYGHQAGDRVLVNFVKTIDKMIRKDLDWIARYGGEEFIVVLPDTGLADATMVAEKLRASVFHSLVGFEDNTIQISASFGLAACGAFEKTSEMAADSLIKTADENLYRAKNNGRNQVAAD
jgi:two-component system cell cycle response regulator